ncbi:MAG: group II intron reverse transcriptase/maturase [Actinobacteria bacterium]|nr:group II intron reverse transcriptase/maturase [Actinomycetota bacterium]
MSSDLDRVRQAALKDKEARFTALLHHVTVERLRAAYRAIRPGAAAGVDGVTWRDYGQDLEGNLADLHGRVHGGAYRAKPSRRVFIPKADGRLRPLGVAALEDKILQRAVVEVLNAIYECDFVGFSYGFRPGRSAHDALDALAVAITRRRVSWVLDADIRDYFSKLDHSWLGKFLEHRIADKRVLRLIQKWLRAGVIENGTWTARDEGTPQGASVSTLLANVYLHYVFDQWVQQWRGRHARGEMIVVRYADDAVVGFEHHDDAQRFLADLRERFATFNLELAAEKTRLIEFGRFAARNRKARGLPKPETFNFLGLTHICGKRRTTGMEKGMKESYIEDLASHGGPDHALATREGAAKRWTGVRAGRILSLEIATIGVPTRSQTTEGNTAGGVFASRQRTPRGRRTCACARSLHAENREVPRSPDCGDGRSGRAGNAAAVIP